MHALLPNPSGPAYTVHGHRRERWYNTPQCGNWVGEGVRMRERRRELCPIAPLLGSGTMECVEPREGEEMDREREKRERRLRIGDIDDYGSKYCTV